MARVMNVTAEHPDELFQNVRDALAQAPSGGRGYDYDAYVDIANHISRVSEESDPDAPWYLLDGTGLYPLSGDFDTM
eukprot:3338416-Pyramimonas_sp.AAC.1